MRQEYKLNPYDYPVYMNRLRTSRIEHEMSYLDAEQRDEFSRLAHEIPSHVMSKLLLIMKIESRGGVVYRCLEKLEDDIARRKSAFAELLEKNDLSMDEFMILEGDDAIQCFIDSGINQHTDLEDLYALIHSVDQHTASKLNRLFECAYGISIDELFDTEISAFYTYPEKTVIDATRDFGGRTFFESNNGYVRDYIACSQYLVTFPMKYETEDEYGDTVEKTHVEQLGSGATLKQAIEVAMLASQKVMADQLSNGDGTIVENEFIYIKRKGTTVVRAELKHENGRAFLDWEMPIENEIERTQLKLEYDELRNQRIEESRADNYSTCHQIYRRMDEIKRLLTPAPVSKVKLMREIAQVEAMMGGHSFVRRQLEKDLGL